MAVTLVELRKVAVVKWDADIVKGKSASMQVQGQEKRTVDNDGESNLFFPMDYYGSVKVTIEGSKSGEDTGTLEIS